MQDKRVETFDDWKDLFQAWQKGIGYDRKLFSSVLKGYEFGEKFGGNGAEVGFGDFIGARKWEQVSEIPRPEIKELLLKLITVQGDTEFASVEQQRRLLERAPTERDRYSMVRINAEEMRHGWQMSYLLVRHFGDEGKAEARKLMDRCADRKERLLGAFNEPMQDWLDFFTYTAFVDRDGMYQLKMLSHSGFAPLSRSMGPMLNEESFHLLTGLTGLQRVLKAGKVPVELVQKVINRWLPRCYDLFGMESSRGAGHAYQWGLKGRFNEPEAGPLQDPTRINEQARGLYWNECKNLIELLNREVSPDKSKLYAPDIKFNRHVGEHKGQPYSVKGDRLDRDAFERHAQQVLPTEADRQRLSDIAREPDWVGGA